ncbi:hypothetical protein [Proteiniborus sp.]|uniref:hypothetical protein n=1 Tax=Proteiniborus sp. TaxID=2079015 RepID=UPI0033276656
MAPTGEEGGSFYFILVVLSLMAISGIYKFVTGKEVKEETFFKAVIFFTFGVPFLIFLWHIFKPS